jgi:hypothetical protein
VRGAKKEPFSRAKAHIVLDSFALGLKLWIPEETDFAVADEAMIFVKNISFMRLRCFYFFVEGMRD